MDAASTSVDKTISEEEKSKSLYYRSVKQRVIVSIGGPAANYLLAIVLFFAVFFLSGQPEVSSKIDSFVENSPAKAAGLIVGDEIKSINGKAVNSFSDVLETMGELKSPEVNVEVQRDGSVHRYMFLANSVKMGDSERYILGIKTGRGSAFQFGSSLTSAVAYPLQVSWATLLALKRMILKSSMDGLGGPIAMAKGIKTAASMGVMVVIFYAALISTSLGVFNLLPIPTLDGGHIMFAAIEGVRGRPVSEKIQEWAFAIGLGALVLLTLIATYKDVFFK
jgi:regulator of sigma E protease